MQGERLLGPLRVDDSGAIQPIEERQVRVVVDLGGSNRSLRCDEGPVGANEMAGFLVVAGDRGVQHDTGKEVKETVAVAVALFAREAYFCVDGENTGEPSPAEVAIQEKRPRNTGC